MSSNECVLSQMFLDLTAHPVVFWHPQRLDKDAGFYHLMPQSRRWHCYSRFLAETMQFIAQVMLQPNYRLITTPKYDIISN